MNKSLATNVSELCWEEKKVGKTAMLCRVWLSAHSAAAVETKLVETTQEWCSTRSLRGGNDEVSECNEESKKWDHGGEKLDLEWCSKMQLASANKSGRKLRVWKDHGFYF